MASLTQGRVIADTDAERVIAELREFDRKVGTRFHKLFAEYVKLRFTGNIRMSVKFRDGRMIAAQFNPDDEIRLDGEREE